MEHNNGCQHYLRNCLVQAPCCKIFYFCKLCHDQKYQGPKSKGCHTERMEFQKVQKIKCLECQTQQIPTNECSNCSIKFGQYACLLCKLYQNNPNKVNDIFHCDQCMMCRRGKRQEIFHCSTCGYCRPLSQKNKHKCTENVALSKCPICLEVLKYSVKYYITLKCGHLVHVECLEGYNNINCPVCGMATQNLGKSQNNRIQKLIQSTKQQLPQQLKNKKVNVLCNQCLHKTMNANFHFYGVKCQSCGTYNTKMI